MVLSDFQFKNFMLLIFKYLRKQTETFVKR